MSKLHRIPPVKIAVTAMFTALSLVIILVIPKFRVFPMAYFLEYDFADVPIIILTMIYGPVYGLITTAIVSLFQGFLLSDSGPLGVLMHFVATGAFVLVFGCIFRKFKSVKSAIIGAFAGVIAWTGIMVPFNILITPIFMGVTRDLVYPILLPAIVPFNLIKSIGNSVIAIVLYYMLKRVLRGRARQMMDN